MFARAWLALAASLALTACDADGAEATDRARGEPAARVGLFSTLPIYWPESAEFGDILRNDGEKSWVRRAIEAEYDLAPLDTFDAATLANLDLLILAQPRALSAAENVALDDWVRGGGRVLVFADPMLTFHSRFPMGDRRRPQDVVLLSPILARWGLELVYDDSQPEGERMVATPAGAIPVDLAGQFVARETAAPADCAIAAESLVARCSIGEGKALLIADAAMLDSDDHAGHSGSHDEQPHVLGELMQSALRD